MRKTIRDYFLPHAGNDYKPHALQRVAMLSMLVLVLITFTVANLQSFLWMSSDWLVSAILPGVIVELTNDERSGEAAAPLRRTETLDAAATLKAQHMAANQYFSHYSPDGVSPWYWFDEVGYRYAHAGENLAIHFSDSGEVVEAWMNSPAHRANIVNRDYREIGVGTARGTYKGRETVYVVQLFGTPSVPTPATGNEVTVAQTRSNDEPGDVLSDQVSVQEANTAESATDEEAAASSSVAPERESETSSEPAPFTNAQPNTVTTVRQSTDDEDMVSVYTETIATSSGAAPAPSGAGAAPTTRDGFFGTLLTSPGLLLQIMYVSVGALVVLALLLSIFIEIRHQRPVQIAYGFGLLAMMGALSYLHSLFTAGAVVI